MSRQLPTGFVAAAAMAALLCLPIAAQTSTSPAGDNNAAAPEATAPAANQPSAQATSVAGASADQNAPAEVQSRPPLQAPVKQGFWGRLNPFARKKYVQTQLSPIRDRVNELNGLSASNAKSISDLDRSARAGIAAASERANQAGDTAAAAEQRVQQTADQAKQLDQKVDAVNNTLQSADQYTVAQTAELHFRPGPARLNQGAEQQLSSFLQGLEGQKGYIVEVTAYSTRRGQAGIAASQDLANAVVRYMVLDQNIPLFRIYTSGMGNAAPVQGAQLQSATTRRTRGGTVQIRILKNGLAGNSNS